MSVDSAKEFLERVRNDEDFRKSVGEIVTAEERMEFVKGAGFDFTKEEIKSIQDELSDDDLDRVAGGWCGLSLSEIDPLSGGCCSR